MNHVKKLLTASLLGMSLASHAGFWGVTIHSRANCGNNESITWYANHWFYWNVYSYHNYNYNDASKGYHLIMTGLSLTWRQAGVHWGESGPTGIYGVTGFHYYYNYDEKRVMLDNTTYAADCSIYDGWWD